MSIKDIRILAFVFLAALVIASCTMQPKAGKVYDPGEVSASCAGDMDIDAETAMALTVAFSDADGYVTDEFKKKAANYISMSEDIPADARDQTLAGYLSCLEKNASQ